jgi:hypothetical protein
MPIGLSANGSSIRLLRPLKVLTPEQVAEIDRALEEVGPFGEVRLVKAKGKVRFIQRLESRELPRGGRKRPGDGPSRVATAWLRFGLAGHGVRCIIGVLCPC